MKRGLTTHREGTSYDDTVRDWFARLDRGIKKRQEQEDRWSANEAVEDMKQWYDGKEWQYGDGAECTINKGGSYIRTYRAAVAYDNPRVKMTPKNAAGWEMVTLPIMGQDGQVQYDDETGEVMVIEMTRAEARERLINDIISKPQFGLRDTISRIVKAGCLGYGAAIVGYAPAFETPLPKDSDDEVPRLEDGSIDFDAYIIDPVTGVPMQDEDGKPIKKNRMPVHEEWFIDWVHYRDVIIDPDGGNDFMKHRWVAIEQTRTLEEVKADPLFKNTKNLQATVSRSDDHGKPGRHAIWGDTEQDSEPELVRLFWVYDLVRDRRLCLADGHGEALLDEVTPPGITHSPLAFFRPNERIGDEEEFYPRPIMTDLIPLIIENNLARSMLHIGDKRAIRKILVKKGFLDDEAKLKLTNDNDMELVEFDGASLGTADIQASIFPLRPPDIGGDRYNHLQIISKDFDEIGGMGGSSRGASTSDTATEIEKRSAYEGTRYDFDRKQLKDMLVLLLKKLDDSLDANMTKERAITISGTAGQLQQVLLDRDLIECDCDVDIDLADMTPTDDAGDAARMLQFAQVIGQNRWMARNPEVLRGFANRLRINDENFIRGMVEAVQIEDQMLAQQAMAQAQPKVPEAGIPETAAQAQMQTGAGAQVPRQQGGA